MNRNAPRVFSSHSSRRLAIHSHCRYGRRGGADFRCARRGERIVLYGDYDVTASRRSRCSCVCCERSLATGGCFLPSRVDEGYGLSADGVARCVSEHAPQLMIAVDCGTSSVAEIAALQAQGVDVDRGRFSECKDARPRAIAR